MSRDQYGGYWLKAGEFAAAMDENLARGNWNAAVMSAIHAAILANDALLGRGRARDLCKKARRFIAWVDSLLSG